MSTFHTSSRRHAAISVRGRAIESRAEALVGEEPLQIRAAGPGEAPQDIAITMRTPGFEEELAIGFLLAEGVITVDDARDATFAFGDPIAMAQPHDEIVVRLPRPLDHAAVTERHFAATASCGICGRASTDELVARVARLPSGPALARSVLARLPSRMRDAQAVFETTGGVHAAALFTPRGELIDLREDVGRHNALDKLVGARALAGDLPARDTVLLVSGRVSFEIVQKAAVAGISVLAAVSAPSDLSVSTAESVGMTLIGFLRGDGFNVYTGAERLDLEA